MQVSVPVHAKEQNLVYKAAEGRALWLRFLPPVNRVHEKAPLYFIVPGGGWAESVKENMIAFSRPSVDALRAEGWAVASVEYRLWKRDGASMADILSDVYDAARYLAAHAEVLGIDARRVLYSGHSAGGQLCLMLALREKSLTAIGCAPLSPPTVFYPVEGQSFYPDTFWRMENLSRGRGHAGGQPPSACEPGDLPPAFVRGGCRSAGVCGQLPVPGQKGGGAGGQVQGGHFPQRGGTVLKRWRPKSPACRSAPPCRTR